MRKNGKLIVSCAFFLAAAGLVSTSCGTTKAKGSLVVALDTDVKVPENVDGIGIAISVDNVTRYSRLFAIDPAIEQANHVRVVKLPATVAVIAPNEGSPVVNVRAVAFWRGEARIVRDAITTIPHERTAVLRLPLAYLGYKDGTTGKVDPGMFETLPVSHHLGTIHLNDVGVNGGVASDIVTKISDHCSGQGKTSVDGECVDAHVDSTTLPDFVESDFFKNGLDDAGIVQPEPCLDMDTCFAPDFTTTAALDKSNGQCTFPLTGNPADLNVAMLLAPDPTHKVGFCVGSRCMIPISRDDAHGFVVDAANGVVRLPRGVCDRATVAGILTAHRAGCPQKTPNLPIDGAGASCLGDAADGGTDGGEAAAPVTPWMSFPTATSVAVYQSDMFVTGTSQVIQHVTIAANGGANPGSTISSPTVMDAMAPPTRFFIAADSAKVYASYGTSHVFVAPYANGMYGTATDYSTGTTTITSSDQIEMVAPNCLVGSQSGTCFPSSSRTLGTFPFLPGGGFGPAVDQTTPAGALGTLALGANGSNLFGLFTSSNGAAADLLVANVSDGAVTATIPGAKGFAIAVVTDATSRTLVVLTAEDATRANAVRVGVFDPAGPMTTAFSFVTSSPVIAAKGGPSTFMHNLAHDSTGYVYFTDDSGVLYSFNPFAAIPAFVPVGVTAQGSFGVAVSESTAGKFVFRAFSNAASAGLTQDKLPHP
jgi:hypothetical protein